MELIKYKPLPPPQPTRNVALMMELAHRLADRPAGVASVGAFFGMSGLGKTEAARYVHQRFNAIRIRVGNDWTKTLLVDALLAELSVFNVKGTVGMKCEMIMRAITDDPRLIIVDEADYLLNRNMIDTLRDIVDNTMMPMIIIGEENLEKKLAPFKRQFRRTLDWVKAEYSNLEDARLYAKCYAPSVRIADNLLQMIIEQNAGNAGLITTSIVTVREFAVRHGLDAVDLKVWGQQPTLSITSRYKDHFKSSVNTQ